MLTCAIQGTTQRTMCCGRFSLATTQPLACVLAAHRSANMGQHLAWQLHLRRLRSRPAHLYSCPAPAGASAESAAGSAGRAGSAAPRPAGAASTKVLHASSRGSRDDACWPRVLPALSAHGPPFRRPSQRVADRSKSRERMACWRLCRSAVLVPSALQRATAAAKPGAPRGVKLRFGRTCDFQLSLTPPHLLQYLVPLALVHAPALIQSVRKHGLLAQHRHRRPAQRDGGIAWAIAGGRPEGMSCRVVSTGRDHVVQAGMAGAGCLCRSLVVGGLHAPGSPPHTPVSPHQAHKRASDQAARRRGRRRLAGWHLPAPANRRLPVRLDGLEALGRLHLPFVHKPLHGGHLRLNLGLGAG